MLPVCSTENYTGDAREQVRSCSEFVCALCALCLPAEPTPPKQLRLRRLDSRVRHQSIAAAGVTAVTLMAAAASLIVVLLWVYYSAQIFLFGAEFTWVFSHKFGSRKGEPLPVAGIVLPAPD